ncbi:hypothetical protein [Mucilaginibacter gotjawali]|uniref:Uncharacterized protein n=2 Tax=Mucilaginibacter gotjawali TaxID=1550579 RepID=A0A0X8X4Q1_9SPHI|nr:hypothetical protein [Mucilaginibacter gotjawali]MBB3058731.1 hypothetical protein [Mucilaginibacter gotjawali]BAU55665.1 hypothetical protein MgSA37_03856 [Mucilaginibacter gotjawali]
MFYIDQTTPSFINARDEHYTNVRYVIKKKLLGKRFTEAHPKGLDKRIDEVTGIHSTVAAFLNDETNLKDLLIGTPDVLNQFKKRFISKKAIASIKALIRYDAFIDKSADKTFGFYNGYHLAENLGMQTCIYCNRLYTHTIITENREFIARPTFDHWFPQSSYPLLALSFYNLVPSCNVCNSSIKGASPLALKDIFHPYLRHPDTDKLLSFKFSYTLEDHLAAKSKIISGNEFTNNSIKAMKLKELYSGHLDEIRELIYLKKAYSASYINSLNSILKLTLSTDEIYRLAFGVFLDDEHLSKRPLSKLKKDVLAELGIIP